MGAAARGTRGAVCLFVLFSLLAMVSPETLAATLQGTIYGGGTPIASAQVTLVNAATLANLGTATSGSGGGFSFTVADGTYNLSITAPPSSGYGDSVVNGIVVSGFDVTQNIVLIKKGYILSGVVRNPAGTPVSNIRVTVVDEATGDAAGAVKTDGAGSYSFPVNAGTYRIDLLGGARSGIGVPSVPMPQYFTIYQIVNHLAVSGNVTQDITIPVATLSGRTVDPAGNPVSGVLLSSVESFSVAGSSRFVNNDLAPNVVSGADGAYAITFLSYSGNRVTLVPPAGKGLAQTTLKVGTTADEVRELTVPQGVQLSGVVRNASAQTASNIKILVEDDATGAPAGTVLPDPAGAYAITVLPGTYRLTVQGGFRSGQGSSTVPTPQFFRITGIVTRLAVAADTIQDLVLPLATITGKTVDKNGVAVPGVKLSSGSGSTTSVGLSAVWDNSYNPNIISDSDGKYALTIIAPATVSVTLIPAPTAGVAQTSVSVTASADTIQDLALPPAIYLTGIVRGPTGQPAANIKVSAVDETTWLPAGEQKTDAAGAYSFPLVPGRYVLSVEGGYRSGQGAPGIPSPQYFAISPFTPSIQLTGTLKKDLVLPFVTLSGKVTDGNGVGIDGVSITSAASWREGSTSYSCYNESVPYVSSDAGGSYALTLVRSSEQSETIIPPPGSGFVQASLDNLSVTRSLLQNIVLSLPDVKDPVIISGPAVSAITDATAVVEWQTDEPTEGGAAYGATNPPLSNAAESGFRSRHSVALSGLTADTVYFVKVFASDKEGNGPVSSGIVSFRTKAAADTKAPVFVDGPVVSPITHNAATVSWKTDEPTAGTLTYSVSGGSTVEATDGISGTDHRVELTGLAAATAYAFTVSAADAAGNGPTAASGRFTTLAAPDTAPPVIVAGPTVVDVTDTTATIVWRTDEPATSGVSFNDGTSHGMVKDDTLAIDHAIRLTGLVADTAYTFTVSSRDGAGNGPTLGEEGSFTTRKVSDTKPPAITEAPMVVTITHQSAVLRWQTDEPAECAVEYGTSEALGESVARGELRQQHTVPVVGLEPETTYYLRIACTDASGNGPARSAVLSFVTEALPDTAKPVITKKPEVVRQTDDTVTLEWETDEPSDSVVEYGEGDTVGQQRADGAKVTDHQVTLGNLKPGTSYRFVVSSSDMNGNTTLAGLRPASSRTRSLRRVIASEPVSTFTTGTQADETAPQITSGPTVQSVTDTRAVIGWTTDEIAGSTVRYGTGGALDITAAKPDLTLDHVIVLTNLTPGTTYSFQASSIDPSWNGPTESSIVTFTTANAPDVTAPVFAVPPATTTVTGTSAVITWTTDEPSTGEVVYGTAADDLDIHRADSGLTRDHAVTLTNLEPGQTYYFAAVAIDTSGNRRQSGTDQFVATGSEADTTGPSGTIAINGGAAGTTSRDVTLTLTCSDPSGCTEMRFSDDGSTWTAPEAYAASKAWQLSEPDGRKTVFVRFRDGAGNWSPAVADAIVQDVSAPRAILQVVNGIVSPTRSRTLAFGVEKDDVVTFRYRLNGGSWSSDVPATTTVTLQALTDGAKTLEVVGKDAAGNWQTADAATSLSWVVDGTAPVTVASPAGGTYTEAQTVTLTANEAAIIYYTLNGLAPTTSSAQYTMPLTVPMKATLRFFAVDAAGNTEGMKTQVYGAPPVALVTGGTALSRYTSTTLSVQGPDVIAYKYQLDGGAWSAELPVAAKIVLVGLSEATHTVNVRGKNPGGAWQPADSPTVVTWRVDVTSPVASASPRGGIYMDAQRVTLSSTEAGTIYYTINGSNPTVLSTKYTVPLTIAPGTVLKFMTVDAAGNPGAVVTESYQPQVKAVILGGPPAVTRSRTATIKIAGDYISTYKYSLDDGPYSAERAVSTLISLTGVAEGSHTIKVVGKKITGDWQPVDVASSLIWRVDLTAPVTIASPAGGSLADPVTVALTASEAGITYYTTDGTTPTTLSRKYAAPLAIAATTTVKFFTVDTAGNAETVKVETYMLPPVAVLTGAPGSITKNRALSIVVGGATVTAYKYSLDGGGYSAETPVGTRVTASGLAQGDHTLDVIGRNSAGTWQAVPTSIAWTVDTTVPAASASPAGGTYSAPQRVTLTADETATIYFTTNGATPTTASLKYTAPLPVVPPAVVKFMAVDAAGNASPVITERYSPPLKATFLQRPAESIKVTSATFTIGGSGLTHYRYSLDGGPYSSDILLSTRISLAGLSEESHTITVLGGNASGVWQPLDIATTYTWAVDLTPGTVTASPAGKNLTTPVLVTLTGSEQGTIYYTLNGAAPTTSSSKYTAPVTVDPGKTLKFFILDKAGNAGVVQTETYPAEVKATLTGIPAVSTRYPAVSVMVGGSRVIAYRYSLDGGPYGTTSLVTTRINLSGLALGVHTLAVIGKNSAGTWQVVPTIATWTIEQTPPVTTASPAGGAYDLPQTVTLSSEEGAMIFYTTNGLPPSTSSSRYRGPIPVTTTTMLRYYAVDAAGNAEQPHTESYVIPPAALVSGAPPATTSATSITFTVGGDNVWIYKYRLDAGSWSPEIPVTSARTLAGLAAGEHTLSVVGKNPAGTWQSVPTVITWTVQ